MDKHIVYRSQYEAYADQFWWDFLTDHYVGVVVTIIVAAVALCGLWIWSNRRR